MKYMFVLVAALLLSANTSAALFKCANKATGEIEYKDKSCNPGEEESASVKNTSKNAADLNKGESIALQMIINDKRDDFKMVCKEKLNEKEMSKQQYVARCESALKKYAECRVTAMKMFPQKVSASYFQAVAEGKSEEEATRLAKTKENWGVASTDEAMRISLPVIGYLSECIGNVFK